MCLIAFAWQSHPRYPLVLAANRDEFHARPSAPLAAWDDPPGAIGGRDLQAGGAWLAARRRRLAAVTNVREPSPAATPRSRGQLVADFVRGSGCAAGFAETVEAEWEQYGPFNLLLYDGEELVWASNRPKPAWKGVAPGVHGVSNGAPSFISGVPPWPKVRRLTAALEGWLTRLKDTAPPDPEPLFAALADTRPADDAELPETGVGLALERRLSPPFIRGTDYGTRCSTVGWVDGDGRVTLIERRFGPDGIASGERRATAE